MRDGVAEITSLTDTVNELSDELDMCKEDLRFGGKTVGVGGGRDLQRISRLLDEKLHVEQPELIPETANILVAHGITNWTEMTTRQVGRSTSWYKDLLLEFGVHGAHAERIAEYAERVYDDTTGKYSDVFDFRNYDYDWNRFILPDDAGWIDFDEEEEAALFDGPHPRDW
jgi:hypothetical protein